MNHTVILARGTFAVENEVRLMRDHAIDVLVTKNSGGEATYAKIAAARALQLPVVLIRPPVRPDVATVYSVDDCLDVIRAHKALSGSD
jgi:precorrin-6A/cobalt-precorrin-6A reductase